MYALTLTALAAAGIQSMVEEKRLLADTNAKNSVLAVSIEDSISTSYAAKRPKRIARIAERLASHQQSLGFVVCAADYDSGSKAKGHVAHPKNGGWERVCANELVAQARNTKQDLTGWSRQGTTRIQYYAHRIDPPIELDENPAARARTMPGIVAAGADPGLVLVFIQDLSWIRSRWMEAFGRTFALTWLGGLLLLGIVATQARSWFRRQIRFVHHVLQSMARGSAPRAIPAGTAADLLPLTRDLEQLARKLKLVSRRKKESKDNSREASWLSGLQKSLDGRKLVVIANREPYIHQRKDDRIDIVRPASGLVTALEPILRLCGGLWIAHGSGTADREVCNERGEVAVPPGKPSYTLRRVWMSQEEEAGYYYGFSNEGLWPLCHLAHTRPIFRLSDWEQYQAINRRFA
ncbi:MAG TPA: trehalose-6-phosphate synthase, partial [Bdellovibrionota bacterium]|nr:trehalose-6-phosphate synthase [Bdellovibrionota bacterium]